MSSTIPLVSLFMLADADPGVALPSYQTAGAAGADICANLPPETRGEGVLLPPGGRALIPAGFALEIPAGFEAQVRPRSGLALRHGVTVLNSPGTIDSDYRGPLGVILVNLGAEPFTVRHGDRIAQIVVAPVVQTGFRPALALGETARGSGGFGSTGGLA